MSRTFFYRMPEGREPFVEDIKAVRNHREVVRIWARIRRAELGNLGDWRSVGGGVLELRIPEGPGYRVYLGFGRGQMIILLCAGDKSTQEADIRRAHGYWVDYWRHQ